MCVCVFFVLKKFLFYLRNIFDAQKVNIIS